MSEKSNFMDPSTIPLPPTPWSVGEPIEVGEGIKAYPVLDADGNAIFTTVYPVMAGWALRMSASPNSRN